MPGGLSRRVETRASVLASPAPRPWGWWQGRQTCRRCRRPADRPDRAASRWRAPSSISAAAARDPPPVRRSASRRIVAGRRSPRHCRRRRWPFRLPRGNTDQHRQILDRVGSIAAARPIGWRARIRRYRTDGYRGPRRRCCSAGRNGCRAQRPPRFRAKGRGLRRRSGARPDRRRYHRGKPARPARNAVLRGSIGSICMPFQSPETDPRPGRSPCGYRHRSRNAFPARSASASRRAAPKCFRVIVASP